MTSKTNGARKTSSGAQKAPPSTAKKTRSGAQEAPANAAKKTRSGAQKAPANTAKKTRSGAQKAPVAAQTIPQSPAVSVARPRRSVLITGIAGGLARSVAELLVARGDAVVGVDYRTAKDLSPALASIPVYRANYNKTAIEDVFRKHAFTHVLHLGRVGNLKESVGKRFDLNVVGSQKILNLARDHGVKKLVVLSTFHIYGAHQDNHIPIVEDEPLRAGVRFPQLADAIQLDNMASTWIWRHPEVHAVVLRPCNVVGPHLRNTMTELLRQPRIPRLFGFDPMMQFIDERDLARAIVAAADGDASGIFNIAGQTSIPWTTAIELTGAKTVTIPSSMASLAVRLFSALPDYLVDYFKFPCVIGDDAFRKAFGWKPEISVRDTITGSLSPL